jgi:hypothetical protein
MIAIMVVEKIDVKSVGAAICMRKPIQNGCPGFSFLSRVFVTD